MKKDFKYIILLLIITFSIITILIKNNANSSVNNEELAGIKISFIDVGQADSILIQCNNENMLIDAGNTEDGPKLVSYFKQMGINEFKYVVGTHAHEDHIGGMSDVINNFKIDKFLMPDVITTTKTFEDTLDALNNNNVKFETPKIGDSYDLSTATFDILYVGEDSKNLNNDSIVIKMIYGNTKYLFMGDATTNVEKDIIKDDLEVDVLKVGHHGSKTSSSKDFIYKVKPKYAIISVGKDNSYNLPSNNTIELLKKVGATIYRTDNDGTIIITSDGHNISIGTLQTDTNGG